MLMRVITSLLLLLLVATAGRAAAAPEAPASGSQGGAEAGVAGGIDSVPEELQGIDIVEHLDASLPLDLTFVDEQGVTRRLGDYFTGEKPVIISLNYYRCPMLCTLTLNGLVKAMKSLEWSAGKEFTVLTFSFDPREPHQLAKAKQDAYLIDYDRAGSREGWHFHVSPDDSVKKLADAMGFNYRFVPERDEWSHAACVVMCTPDGRISRYLYGASFKESDFKLAVVEAGQGKVGSAFDRFLLWCHYYDPHSKGYAKSAMSIMKLGGAFTVLTMAVGLFVLWRMDFLQSRASEAAAKARTALSPGDSMQGATSS